jgi:hypothetical protein
MTKKMRRFAGKIVYSEGIEKFRFAKLLHDVIVAQSNACQGKFLLRSVFATAQL